MNKEDERKIESKYHCIHLADNYRSHDKLCDAIEEIKSLQDRTNKAIKKLEQISLTLTSDKLIDVNEVIDILKGVNLSR